MPYNFTIKIDNKELWKFYENGMMDIDNNELDKVWCKFYKIVDLLDVIQEKEIDLELYKIKYKMLNAISDIQMKKKYFDASKNTFIQSEKIRTKYLINEFPKSETKIAFFHLLEQKETINIAFDAEHYEIVLTLGELLIKELEALSYDEQSKKDRRLLWQVYELLHLAALALDNKEKADEYEEKAEDLAFIHGFNRLSIFAD